MLAGTAKLEFGAAYLRVLTQAKRPQESRPGAAISDYVATTLRYGPT